LWLKLQKTILSSYHTGMSRGITTHLMYVNTYHHKQSLFKGPQCFSTQLHHFWVNNLLLFCMSIIVTEFLDYQNTPMLILEQSEINLISELL
jgi:hypothetical protein